MTNIRKKKLRTPVEWPVITQADTTALQDYTGTYEMEDGDVLIFIVKEGKLIGRPKNGKPLELRPVKPDHFYINEINLSVAFEKDKTGKVMLIEVSRGDEHKSGKRVEEAEGKAGGQ